MLPLFGDGQDVLGGFQSAQMVVSLRASYGIAVYDFPDGAVDAGAGDGLALGARGSDALALADVVGHLPAPAAVIADRHALAAHAAHDQSLQQRRSLPGRTSCGGDSALEDSENLPDPAALAAEIVEDLRAALEAFRAIARELEPAGDGAA